jgi:hypothetical protein
MTPRLITQKSRDCRYRFRALLPVVSANAAPVANVCKFLTGDLHTSKMLRGTRMAGLAKPRRGIDQVG